MQKACRKGWAMLVLSRKPGEKILIGDNVTITIVRIGPNTVRLGIDAPREMNIVREELCQTVRVGEGLPGGTRRCDRPAVVIVAENLRPQIIND
jgi:carbon storage regulator